MGRLALVSVVISAVACSAGSARDTPTGLAQDSGKPPGFDLETGNGGLDGAADGTIDPDKDNDGDGYFFKDDCDDRNPEVNPGAFEVPGDGVDNDCDGVKDNVDPDCDQLTLKYDSKDPMDFARALGLCRTTKAELSGKDKRWGVIKAELVRADGSKLDSASNVQFGILKNFGKNVLPRKGKNMIVLSSGTARTPAYPGFKKPRTEHFTSSSSITPPAGHPKPTPGCVSWGRSLYQSGRRNP